MCGIVGIVKKEGKSVSQKEFNDFLIMLKEAETRGRQATGVLYIFEDGTSIALKSPIESSNAVNFISHRRNIRAIFGHTRTSTGGFASKNSNNHPHSTKNWFIVHNGHCNSKFDDKDLDLKTECDTERFIATIEKVNEKNTNTSIIALLKDSMSYLSGGWAVALYHKQSKKIFLTTNGRNPLCCAYIKDGVFFASSGNFIKKTLTYKEGIGDKKEKVCKIGWDGSSSNLPYVDFFQIFEPKLNIIFECNKDALIINKGSYVHAAAGANNKAISLSNNSSYYQSMFTDPDLMNEDTWQNSYGDSRYDLYTEIDRHGDMKCPIYNVTTQKVRFDGKYTEKELKEYAIRSLKLEAEFYRIPRSSLRLIYNNNKRAAKPPKEIMMYVNRLFYQSFTDEVFTTIDLEYHKKLNPKIWDLTELDKDKKETLSRKTLSSISWLYRVLIARFGVSFENHLIKKEDKLKKIPKLQSVHLTYIDSYEDSKYMCKECLVFRKSIKIKPNVIHCCPLCKSEFIETIENNTKTYMWRNS